MYRVAIIDDEPIIVEGISRIVPWSKYDCMVVGTAENGADGAALIRSQEPDIIFSDIAMPDMDGLTMVAGLKSEFPSMQVCILTGFRDFDFAQRAIRLGVCRFLLKPSNMEEIEEALRAMTVNLDRIYGTRKQSAGQGKAAAISERAATEAVSELAAAAEGAAVLPDAGEDTVASSFIVKNALKYIQNNYTRKLTLSEVAEKTYVSQWHLSKLLNRHTGQNFSEILNTTRLEEAKKLLINPALRIGEIAETVGFLDLAHFSRVFKKTYGISANEFRNTLAMSELRPDEAPEDLEPF